MNIDIRNALNQISKLISKQDGTSPCGYGFVLEEFSENLTKLGSDPSLINEFIELYCLKEK